MAACTGAGACDNRALLCQAGTNGDEDLLSLAREARRVSRAGACPCGCGVPPAPRTPRRRPGSGRALRIELQARLAHAPRANIRRRPSRLRALRRQALRTRGGHGPGLRRQDARRATPPARPADGRRIPTHRQPPARPPRLRTPVLRARTEPPRFQTLSCHPGIRTSPPPPNPRPRPRPSRLIPPTTNYSLGSRARALPAVST